MSWQAAIASPRLRRLPEGAGSPLTGLPCAGASSASLHSPRGPHSPLAGSSLPTPRCGQTPLDSLPDDHERASLPGSPLLPSLGGDTGRVCFSSMTCRNNTSQDLRATGETPHFQGIDPKYPATESFDTAVRLISHAVNFTAISFVHATHTQ